MEHARYAALSPLQIETGSDTDAPSTYVRGGMAGLQG